MAVAANHCPRRASETGTVTGVRTLMLGTAPSPGPRGSAGVLLVGEFLTLEVLGVMVLTLRGQKPMHLVICNVLRNVTLNSTHHRAGA